MEAQAPNTLTLPPIIAKTVTALRGEQLKKIVRGKIFWAVDIEKNMPHEILFLKFSIQKWNGAMASLMSNAPLILK